MTSGRARSRRPASSRSEKPRAKRPRDHPPKVKKAVIEKLDLGSSDKCQQRNLRSRFGGIHNEKCSTGCPWGGYLARRLWPVIGSGLADPQCHRGGADPGRRCQRHHRPRGVRAGWQAGRADLRDRESAGGRWYDRRQHGRQGRAGRPYHSGLWLDCGGQRTLCAIALRYGCRFHAGGSVWRDPRLSW